MERNLGRRQRRKPDVTGGPDLDRRRRFSLLFSESQYSVLMNLAEQQEKSAAKVIRDALLLEEYIYRHREQGSRIEVIDRDGVRRELFLR